jgi:hypothetical protein
MAAKRADLGDAERVDRYAVASWLFRFWWVVAILGFAGALWLLSSIADSSHHVGCTHERASQIHT